MKTILTCAVLICAAGCTASKDNPVTPTTQAEKTPATPAEKTLEQRIAVLEKRVTDYEAANQEQAQQIAELRTQLVENGERDQLVERGKRDVPPDSVEPPKVALFRAQLESFTDEVHAAVAVLSLGTTAEVAQQRRETIVRQYSLIVIPPTLKFSPDGNVTQAVEIIESDLAVIVTQVNSLVSAYERLIEIETSKEAARKNQPRPGLQSRPGQAAPLSEKLIRDSRSYSEKKAEEKKEAECQKILAESFQIIEDSVTSIERHVLHNFRKPFPPAAAPSSNDGEPAAAVVR